LACEKLSGYWKDQGVDLDLLLDYSLPECYDVIYISKVFTDTPVPEEIMHRKGSESEGRICMGGTGFYFDKAPNLPFYIEHHKPDYSLYDGWIAQEVERARKEKGNQFNERSFMVQFKEYTSIVLAL